MAEARTATAMLTTMHTRAPQAQGHLGSLQDSVGGCARRLRGTLGGGLHAGMEWAASARRDGGVGSERTQGQ